LRFFLASILKFVLFLYYLCQNIKILQKNFFDQSIIGGDTIFPLSLRLSGIEFSFCHFGPRFPHKAYQRNNANSKIAVKKILNLVYL
jgi:hypothetical protein